MPKQTKNPSKRAVSAASAKGNAGPHNEPSHKKTSSNAQYGAENMQ